MGASAAVGTSVQSLRAAIARALGRSDVVILMGGLGPGPDGIAKETVCEGSPAASSCTSRASSG